MSSADDASTVRDPTGRLRERLPLTDSLVVWGIAVAVLVALVLRLVFLGDRIAHYDEGRVAYWTMHTLETGHFAYRRIIHGPFLQHVSRWLFGIFGASDFVMRLPVALVGALLPASAYLFRKHLREREVVAMAFVLALNPVLLYYSRFYRSDILVAAFMFVSLGFLVRFYDSRRVRYVFAASAFAALGFTAKENAIVYVLTWLGAFALLADQALFRPRGYDSGAQLLWVRANEVYAHLRDDRVRPWLDAVRRLSEGDDARVETDAGRALEDDEVFGSVLRPLRFLGYVGVTVGIAVLVLLFFYAIRGAGNAGLTYPLGDPAAHLALWDAVGNPGAIPDLVGQTWSYASEEYVRWFTAASDPGCHKDNIIDGWLCYAGRYVRVMVLYAGPLTAFAVMGFLAERYGSNRSRNLVLFAAYGGFVSIVGYPLGTDVWGAWIVVHALVPLSIPAAVGIGVIVRWGREAFVAEDQVGVAIAVLLLVASVGVAGFVAVDSVYTNDTAADNHLVQYAQPDGDAKATVLAVERAAAANEGTDVLLYYGASGSGFNARQAIVKDRWSMNGLATDPMCSRWYNLLPLPWYLERADADVTCERSADAMRDRMDGTTPPVVVTVASDPTVPRDALAAEYVSRTHEFRTTDTNYTFWIRPTYAEGLPPADSG